MDNKPASFDLVMGKFAKEFDLASDRAIAETLGMSPTAYSNRKKRGAIPYKEVIEFLSTQNMDFGRMLLETGNRDSSSIKEESIYKATSEFVPIPRYDIQAAAGHGAINDAERPLEPLAFRRDWLAARHLSPSNLVVIQVHGDSMEGKLSDGDLVLIDRAQTHINSGSTYLIRVDDLIMIKNLQWLPGGMVQVASFNAGFPPYAVTPDKLTIIGRVVVSMHEWN